MTWPVLAPSHGTIPYGSPTPIPLHINPPLNVLLSVSQISGFWQKCRERPLNVTVDYKNEPPRLKGAGVKRQYEGLQH